MRELDTLDEEILEILTDDARLPSAVIAEQLHISPSIVRRRIARLEDEVIEKFTISRKPDPDAVEAFVEFIFEGEADLLEILRDVISRPEVREACTIAGDPDAVLRLCVPSLDDLGKVVTELRKRMGKKRPGWRITGSKTLVILDRKRHGHFFEDVVRD